MDSMRHLITPPRGDTIFTAFETKFTGVNQQEGQVRIQVDEANFIFVPDPRPTKWSSVIARSWPLQ